MGDLRTLSSKDLYLRLVSRYPTRVLVNIVLGFSGALFNGVGMALIVPVVLSLMGQPVALGNNPQIIDWLLTPFAGLSSTTQPIIMAGAVIGAIVLKNLANYASALSAGALGRSLTSDLQEEGLKLLLEVDLDFFSKAKVGDLVNRLGGEMNRASGTITLIINLVSTLITVTVFVALLLAISWQLTLAATLIMPLSALITQNLIEQSKRFGKLITDLNHDYSSGLVEVLGGIRLIKATGFESQEFTRFRKLIRLRESLDFQARMAAAAIAPISETINVIAIFLLVFLGRFLFAGQLTSLSTVLLTYLVILSRVLPVIAQLNGIRANLARSTASVDVVNDLLNRSGKTFMANGNVPFSGLKEAIQFKQVSFGYPGTHDIVLDKIDLTIPKGSTLALVGASGAGKSTLADLLPRFYDPTGGCILLDGRPLWEFEVESLRQAMGIVSQDTFLFNDTIRNNIAYGCTNATESQILDVVKRANAYDFIMRLPKGLDTPIGDRGVILSGGQRQRIAIARALLRDPEILILDEATSALDTVSEHLIQQALDDLSQHKTTLVIAHRLSTVQQAEQIAVLERGRVVELGTHEELLRRNGHYAQFCVSQLERCEGVLVSGSDRKNTLAQTSYEFRARLNAMLGSLSLLADGFADTPQEQDELAEEAYRSALELFQTVRRLENAADGLAETTDPPARPPAAAPERPPFAG